MDSIKFIQDFFDLEFINDSCGFIINENNFAYFYDLFCCVMHWKKNKWVYSLFSKNETVNPKKFVKNISASEFFFSLLLSNIPPKIFRVIINV